MRGKKAKAIRKLAYSLALPEELKMSGTMKVDTAKTWIETLADLVKGKFEKREVTRRLYYLKRTGIGRIYKILKKIYRKGITMEELEDEYTTSTYRGN